MYKTSNFVDGAGFIDTSTWLMFYFIGTGGDERETLPGLNILPNILFCVCATFTRWFNNNNKYECVRKCWQKNLSTLAIEGIEL